MIAGPIGTVRILTRKPSVAVQKAASLLPQGSSCGLLNQSHTGIVVSPVPFRFRSVAPQNDANFGIGTPVLSCFFSPGRESISGRLSGV